MKKTILAISALFLISCSAQTQKPPQTVDTTTMDKKIQSCMCVKLYMPVCGEDNKTYGNSCMAECVGVKYTMGQCQQSK